MRKNTCFTAAFSDMKCSPLFCCWIADNLFVASCDAFVLNFQWTCMSRLYVLVLNGEFAEMRQKTEAKCKWYYLFLLKSQKWNPDNLTMYVCCKQWRKYDGKFFFGGGVGRHHRLWSKIWKSNSFIHFFIHLFAQQVTYLKRNTPKAHCKVSWTTRQCIYCCSW